MWIQCVISIIFSLALGVLPVIGSVMYFKHCKAPHAHMLLWSSIIMPIPQIIQSAIFSVIIPSMEEVPTLVVSLAQAIISLVGSIAYLVFGIGFVLLIKKIIKNTTR